MSNWIQWNGGKKCPLAAGTVIDARDLDGTIWEKQTVGKHVNIADLFWQWKRKDRNNIVAYRLSQPDNLQRRVNDASLQQALESDNKYNRQCKGVTIDVYDVLLAFNVTNPALQHLVKKALCTGLRGHKDKSQDLQDILDSAKRALELETDK